MLPGGVKLVQQLGDAGHQALDVGVAASAAATAASTSAAAADATSAAAAAAPAVAIGKRLAALDSLK